MRLSWLAQKPAEWAYYLIYFLPALALLFPTAFFIPINNFLRGKIGFYILFVGFVGPLTYYYFQLLFRPDRIKEKLVQNNFTVLDNKAPWEKTSYLTIGLTILTLIIFVLLPKLLTNYVFLSSPPIVLFGSAYLLVGIGVYWDFMNQLSFLKQKHELKRQQWKLNYVAADELEALIKKSGLEAEGKVALIEPLRFTWGIPIRTIIDEYRIWVAE